MDRRTTGGIILVALGLVFLAATTGLIQQSMWRDFWPVILIVVGVAVMVRRRPSDGG
ncbi:MAG TPA: DUF5668 domain-containing protein [Chloroflexota bacterium]|nr:DUF5668 domain-containing protein [Chloroflexota bacterium]